MGETMKYKSIVVLTGAGISAESGIRTFRDGNGLWENHAIEDVATPEAFERNPKLVHRFYNARRSQLFEENIFPNAAHEALSKLEHVFNGDYLLVTQNVDNLHERAGSENLIHMHGELLNVRCVHSGFIQSVSTHIDETTNCVCCGVKGSLRPDIVWFGEMPLQMDRIYEALSHCDLFISIGTSGHVYPAAGFVEIANEAGAHTVEINLEPSRKQTYFEEQIYGKASEKVTDFVEQLLS